MTQFWAEGKEYIHRRVKPHTFRVETIAPGLSAARLEQTLTPKSGRRKERFCVCGEKASGKRHIECQYSAVQTCPAAVTSSGKATSTGHPPE